MAHQHLSVEEREEIQQGLWRMESLRSIAKRLGRSHSSIVREVNKNLPPEHFLYTPRLANERARKKRKSRGRTDRLKTEIMIGGAIGLVAIIVWLLARSYRAPDEWILGLSLVADLVPLWIIIRGAWEKPEDDKPFAWALFAFGFGISGFGVSEPSVFTLALPVYMFVGANAVVLQLVLYRIRYRMPIWEWI